MIDTLMVRNVVRAVRFSLNGMDYGVLVVDFD
jgi:hypothetical protein